jgi:DNA replication and repair protein RecF
MHIRRLSLTNFRNYARLELELPARVIVLHGSNAQGKPNLLEAIYYLATSRSPQASNDRELINWVADQEELVPYARLEAQVSRGDQARQVEIVLQKEPLGGANNGERSRMRKQIRVNQAKRRALDLVGQINVVLFMPQDMALVDGPPSDRRRYLDVALCQVDGEYCRSLSRYNRVLTSRNALLRQERRVDPDELEYWDEQLVNLGALVMLRRRDAVARLEQWAATRHQQLSGDAERLRLVYQPTLPLNPQDDAPSLQTAYRAALVRRRRQEFERRVTLVGPHRDDVQILANEMDLKKFGSRGQKRTAVLAIKLAELDWMHERTGGETPILLLDEMLAELDQSRRRYLLEQIVSSGLEQVIITSSDLSMFDAEFLSEAKLLEIEGGRVLG